jgi:hypothetical protein
VVIRRDGTPKSGKIREEEIKGRGGVLSKPIRGDKVTYQKKNRNDIKLQPRES